MFRTLRADTPKHCCIYHRINRYQILRACYKPSHRTSAQRSSLEFIRIAPPFVCQVDPSRSQVSSKPPSPRANKSLLVALLRRLSRRTYRSLLRPTDTSDTVYGTDASDYSCRNRRFLTSPIVEGEHQPEAHPLRLLYRTQPPSAYRCVTSRASKTLDRKVSFIEYPQLPPTPLIVASFPSLLLATIQQRHQRNLAHPRPPIRPYGHRPPDCFDSTPITLNDSPEPPPAQLQSRFPNSSSE